MMAGCGTAPRLRGFTLIEIMVVVGIIAVLAAMLMPSLGKSTRTARKLEDLNRLRQIGVAWTRYSQAHDDAVLPGYLSVATQESWNVRYRYPNGSVMMPAPDYPQMEEAKTNNVAGPWSWRLLPLLDYDFDSVLGHRGGYDGALEMEERAFEIRQNPAFAYNSLFVGGWWYTPREYIFKRARRLDGSRLSVVSRTQGSIRRPSQLITYTSAAARDPGIYKYHAMRDDEDGIFTVVPPIAGSYDVWGVPADQQQAGLDVIEVEHVPWFGELSQFALPLAVPIGRTDGKASVLFADGHAEARYTASLDDMRLWIDAADRRDFRFDP
ncbi:MAG: type II secretion system protein [Planctomycetota bacterium]|jgi:prepilin-type N-terminal cleavage/methylation domain-containing protein/prepilin-type processing-associated H-X9-DG protein